MSLVTIDEKGHQLLEEPAAAWLKLKAAAEAAGHKVVVNSAYRSAERQKELYSLYVKAVAAWQKSGQRGPKPSPVAPPGASEHNHGNAVDVAVANAPALHRWLMQNAPSFGFWATVNGERWHWAWYADGPPAKLRARHDANLKAWG